MLHAHVSKARPVGCLMHPLSQRTSPVLAGGSWLCSDPGDGLVARGRPHAPEIG